MVHFKKHYITKITDPENANEHWAEVGIYVVNAKINGRQSCSKNKSPYEIYYGKINVPQHKYAKMIPYWVVPLQNMV